MKQDLLININKHLENVPDGTYISHKIDGNTETSYKLKMKGKGYSKAYLIFPGITLAYQYFLGDKIDFHHDALNTSLEINHCHKGRIGIHMKDNKKVFLGQGDMAFQSMDCCADADIIFPLGYYEGIMINIDLIELEKNLPSFFTENVIASKLLLEKFCKKAEPIALPSNHRIEHIFCELYDIPKEYQLSYMKLKVLELILFLCLLKLDDETILNPYSSEQVEIIKEVHKKLTQNLSKRFTIEELSSEFHINATTLKNTFKNIYGSPIATYMKKYRINIASKMLRENDYSIAKISSEVGYESQGKLTKAFKELVFMSPSDYRKQYK